jgi:hypothetical protein
MKIPIIPQTYAQWRHCVEVECAIPLEPAFVKARLQVLQNPLHEEALRFNTLYGQQHFRNVLGWFEQAQAQSHSTLLSPSQHELPS